MTVILIAFVILGCDRFEKRFYDEIDQGEINAVKNGSDTLDLSTITDFEWDSVILIRGNESVPVFKQEIEEIINGSSGHIHSQERRFSKAEDKKLNYKTTDLPTFEDRFYFLTPDKKIIEKEIESGVHSHNPPFDLNYCWTDSMGQSYWLSKAECKFIVRSSGTIGVGIVLLTPDCETKAPTTDADER